MPAHILARCFAKVKRLTHTAAAKKWVWLRISMQATGRECTAAPQAHCDYALAEVEVPSPPPPQHMAAFQRTGRRKDFPNQVAHRSFVA